MCLYLSGQVLGWWILDGRIIVLKGQGKLVVLYLSCFSILCGHGAVGPECGPTGRGPGISVSPQSYFLPSSHLTAKQGVWPGQLHPGYWLKNGISCRSSPFPSLFQVVEWELRGRFAFVEYYRWILQKHTLRWSLGCQMFVRNQVLGEEWGRSRSGQREKASCSAGLTKPQVWLVWQRTLEWVSLVSA